MMKILHRFNTKIWLVWILLLGFGATTASAATPKVIKTVPENGDLNVDPRLKAIRITFDQDMRRTGYSVCGGGPEFPELVGKPRWASKRMIIMRVKLKPKHEYKLSINCPSAQNFKSAKGIAATVHLMYFKTGSGKGGSRKGGGEKLSFELFDVYGREVHASDYAGSPVLLLSGACWCGGCQQEMHPFKDIADKYGPRGLQLIRSVAGDNELVSLEFQKHYRVPAVHLLDSTREFERQYHRNGWPFVMLVDEKGRVMHKANSSLKQEMSTLKPLLEKALKTHKPSEVKTSESINYMPATLKRSGETAEPRQRDRFASLACGPDGRVYVVFTRSRGGNCDVYLRTYDGGQWGKDMAIAATEADEFDGQVIVDGDNRIWLSWTSNAEGEKYNIFVASCTYPSVQIEPMPITDSDDDAMHARMACDSEDRIWVTYYKWHKMGNYSRDKEVYVRRYNGSQWSREIHVSPTDVPNYEDHTDPAITAYGGGVVIGWSWDFHQPQGYTKEAQTPTIFYRTIDKDLELGEVQHLSRENIDASPTMVVDGKQRLWCAWESLGWDGKLGANRKGLYATRCNLKTNTASTPKQVSGGRINVGGPKIALSPGGTITMVWSERASGKKWVLKQATLESGKSQWSNIKTIESKGNPFFPSASYDAKGNLWIAYTRSTDQGREVTVKKMD
ncbi:MAG: redoxin domain-containing protein [Planctomycetota bacterium]|jgi:peroxiredoxin